MYRKITAAFAATVMITAMFATFMTASAQAESVKVVNKEWAQGDSTYVYELEVSNPSDSAVDEFRVKMPDSWYADGGEGPWELSTLPKDNKVDLLPTEPTTETWIDPTNPNGSQVNDNNKDETTYDWWGAGFTGQHYKSPYENERTWWKFDVGNSLDPSLTADNIENVWWVIGSDVYADEETRFAVYGVDNDDWSYDSITWNNMPYDDNTGQIENFLIPTESNSKGISINVTDFVKSQLSADGTASLYFRSLEEGNESSALVDDGDLYVSHDPTGTTNYASATLPSGTQVGYPKTVII